MHAKWTANALTFSNQSKSVTFSTSAQTVTITGASNGTGSYTYTEKSEKNSGGTATNFISISGTTITLAASTTAGTYTYVVTAKDNNSAVTKDATITITVAKAAATNSVAITGTNRWGYTLTATITTNSNGTKGYQWYYNSSNSASGGTAISGATGSTYVVDKAYVGKYIYVVASVGAGTNHNAASNATDITDATANGTATVAKQDLAVTVTNGSRAYNGSALYATVKVTSANWDGKTIVSGTSTSYGNTVTSTGAVNTAYNLLPGYTDFTNGAKTVYYKVTGGTYYNDKTGSGTVNVTKVTATNTVAITGTNRWGYTLTATITTNSNGTKGYQWYYNASNSTSGGTAISGATSSTYVVDKAYVGKYIYVVASVGAATNYTTPANSTDITDATANGTATVAKQDLAVTVTNGSRAYNGSALYATVKVTSANWDGKTIVSGTSTSYGNTVTSTGAVNTAYNLLPGYTDFTNGAKTVYYKVTGGTYYNDKTGSGTVTVTKANMATPTVTIAVADGKVTWGAITGATSYQISFDNSTWTTATSGSQAINLTSAGTKTAYVRAVSTSTNYNTPSTAGNKSATVYSIAYNANGGSGAPGTQYYIYATSGTINLSSTTPTRSGYNFLGWSLQNNATSASYTAGQAWARSNASNYTLYAVWQARTCTITYNANGGSGAPAAQTYTYATSGTINLSSTIPTLKGNTFLGWSLSSTATSASYSAGQAWNKSNPNDYLLYAVWKANTYTITYNANGGSGAPAAQSYVYATSGTINLSSTVPTYAGHTFLGWSLSSTATTASYSAGQAWARSNASNYTLYAVWQANTYHIYYYQNGRNSNSTLIYTQTVTYGASVTLVKRADMGVVQETIYPQNNWVVMGWGTSASDVTYNNVNNYTDGKTFTYNIAGDLNLYLVYRRSEWFQSGIAPSTAADRIQLQRRWNPYTTTNYFNALTVETPVAISGWTFVKWKTDDGASTSVSGKSGYQLAASTVGQTYYLPYDKDRSFRALYSRTVTIKYDKNGGTGTDMPNTVATQYYNSGHYAETQNANVGASISGITLSQCTYTKSGKTFAGWCKTKNQSTALIAGGGTYTPSVTTDCSSAITLYAIWQ